LDVSPSHNIYTPNHYDYRHPQNLLQYSDPKYVEKSDVQPTMDALKTHFLLQKPKEGQSQKVLTTAYIESVGIDPNIGEYKAQPYIKIPPNVDQQPEPYRTYTNQMYETIIRVQNDWHEMKCELKNDSNDMKAILAGNQKTVQEMKGMEERLNKKIADVDARLNGTLDVMKAKIGHIEKFLQQKMTEFKPL
jgi:hypothetical protein